MGLTLKKFLKLPYKTSCNRLADLLIEIRDDLIESDRFEPEKLAEVKEFISARKDLQWSLSSLDSFGDSRRSKIESTHLLIHKLKEETGYPISENSFIQIRYDDYEVERIESDLIVVLENLRSAFNVGSILRSCECFGVRKIVISGHTPDSEHPSVKKTAKGVVEFLDLQYVEDISSYLSCLKDDGYSLVAAERSTNSSSIYQYQFDKKTAIVLGNEEFGVTEKTLTLMDDVVEIPMHGVKNSLNVGSAAAIMINRYTGQFYD